MKMKFIIEVALFNIIVLISGLDINYFNNNLEINQKYNATGYDVNVEITNYLDIGYVNENDELYNGTILSPLTINLNTNDESNSFISASSISIGNTYYGTYNFLNDNDYYILSSSNIDKIVHFEIDESSKLIIYQKYENNSEIYVQKIMEYDNISISNKIYLMKNYEYYFVIKQETNYIGNYQFKIVDDIIDYDNYYLKTNYEDGIFSTFELIYKNYDNLSDSGIKDGYIPDQTYVQITNIERASNAYRLYFEPTLISGVFDNDGYPSNNYVYDERYITDLNDFPAQCVGMTINAYFDNSAFRGSGFLVHNNAYMTAGHNISNNYPNGNNYSALINMYMHPYQLNGNDNFNYYTLLKAKYSYVPLNHLLENNSPKYDWGIVIYDDNTKEDYGYLGLSYSNSFNNQLYCFGFPGLVYNSSYGNSYNIKLTNSFDNFRMLYGVYVSTIDVTAGNSGGPCLYEDNYMNYVRCIVSGGNETTNLFAPINKYNTNLLLEVV